ncbi:MAG: hypothetical protein ABJF10_18510 [Chthoniobacter sp.]|uniref:hypothetical protein n=1 Tax=Chthoniobacter sp. TaxID=2510640 RepID=UPI0032A57587
MKTNIHRLLLFLAALCLASPLLHAQEQVMVRARVFNVPKNAADALMASSDLHSGVRETLVRLQELVARNQATIMANPSVQTKIGAMATSDGVMKFMAQVAKQGSELDVEAHMLYGEQSLRTSHHVKRGESVFMGSFDAASGGNGTAGSILVFLTIQ